jgi:hypothetical protein
MKKLLVSLIFIIDASLIFAENTGVSDSINDAAVSEIKARYNVSYNKARDFCSGLSDGLKQVKIMTGISVGASAVGTVAGGTAAVTGVMKAYNDKKISELEFKQNDLAKFMVMSPEDLEKAVKDGSLSLSVQAVNEQIDGLDKELEAAKKTSQNLGTARTVGNFVAGGTSVVSAATSFGGSKGLDELEKNMNLCAAYIMEIDREQTELAFAAPTDPDVQKMLKIVSSCSGLNSNNIADIKKKLSVSGVISVVGAVAGISGGITSAVAGGKEKVGASATDTTRDDNTKGLNIASNVMAGVTAATSLTSAVIGGITLAGLNKNSDIADKCRDVF